MLLIDADVLFGTVQQKLFLISKISSNIGNHSVDCALKSLVPIRYKMTEIGDTSVINVQNTYDSSLECSDNGW